MIALGGAALAGCGGQDDGRPTGGEGADDASAADPCRAADGLVFQNILNFETNPARCDRAVDPSNTQQANCLYFNYDSDLDPFIDPNNPPPDSMVVAHSPPLCSLGNARPPWRCTLLSGQLASPDTCAQANMGGGSIPTTPITGDGGVPLDAGGGRCGVSNSAMHLVAKNLSICMSDVTQRQGWGATLSVTFFVNTGGMSTAGYDASNWEGVSFWVRRGTGSSGSAILATVRDPYTAAYIPAEGGIPSSTAEASSATSGCGATSATGGGYCNSANPTYCGSVTMPCQALDGTVLPFDGKLHPCIPDSVKCDPFGGAVLLTDDWRFVKIPFLRTVQKGYGMPTPTGRLDVQHITGLQFSLSPGDWDFWLDDVAFYRQGP